MIDSVLTTALAVSDMEKSLAFYCGLLGFRVSTELPPPAERQRWDSYHERVCRITGACIRVAYLEAPDGATHLELIEYLTPKVPAPPRRPIHAPGVAIVGLAVKDSAAAVARLRAQAVEVLSDPVPYKTDTGERSFTTYFYDPDGNALCFFEVLKD